MGLGSFLKKTISKVAPIVSTVAPFFGPMGTAIGMGAGLLSSLTAPDQQAAAAQQADPFAAQRAQFGTQLAGMTPERLSQLPAVQAGMQATERRAASKGMRLSGNVLSELQQTATATAGGELERMARMASMGAGGPTAAAAHTAQAGKQGILGDIAAAAPKISELFRKGKGGGTPPLIARPAVNPAMSPGVTGALGSLAKLTDIKF